ncbi:SusC/RagA family TonB-linked outer membrane protein [Sphingobacterium bovisgrunnientis]|uniref:SusC/RagA family TonB-linked outer membrane protein n=1 Tax=Sphingobacterium bovisgrunnientis TaxID=1874697 RepID=UPI00135B1FA1|nr:TonB-dependent receptor [Sphingobacterium bovisgrunnientis]
MIKKFLPKKAVYCKTALAWSLVLGTAYANVAVAHTVNVRYETLHLINQTTIQGVITSANGPVSGATVNVKGKNTATSTDVNGKFTISASVGETLVVSLIGYETKELVINGVNISVQLVQSNEDIEEVVVVGYGTEQKKESLTGSLQSVSGNKLRDVTTPSVENMLNGKAAGVFVSPGAGRPGARGAVVIRGQATIGGTTSPLWVIDGVIVGSNPGDINPDDIANMTILKDAASTSIYGSQGANGVIVVTTKRPNNQKMTLSYSTKLGFNQLNNGNLQVMNGQELYDYYKSFANANEISFPRWNEDLRNSNFDWWDLATKNGFVQNHNISLQGGNETLQSFLSLGYYNELGAVKGYDYDRYNVRINTVYKPFEWLSIKPSLVGARRGVEDVQYSTTAMYSNLPWDGPFDENGNLVPHRYSGWVNTQNTNYLYDLQWNKGANTNYELMGNLDFDIKLTDWLTFSSINNYRFNTYSSNSYTDPRSNGGESVNGRLAEYRSEYARRYTNQVLRFNKSWGNHAINGIVGYEFNDYTSKTLDVYGTGFIPGFEVLDVVSKPERTRGGITEWATQSYLSNVNYSYDDRYLAQLSLRRDEASNFGKRFGNFYSISGGWNIHRENWFDISWINNLKLRVAHGTVGNRPAELYPQYNLYSVSASAAYDELPGALISRIGNPNLTWEETATTGFGVDAAFFSNRLRLNFDWYNKNTDNILLNVPISQMTGVGSVYKNIGEMNNKGIELNIGGDIIRNNDLTWSLDINLGHNKNKLTQLYATRQSDGTYVVNPIIVGDALGIAGSASRIQEVGLPINTFYMPEWAGVNVDTGAPMWYKDVKDAEGNVTGQETTSNYAEATQRRLGKSYADLFGGINTFLAYKNFDLNAVLGYAIGGQIYNYSRQEYDSDGTYTDRNQMRLMDGWTRWEKPGDVATHPIAKYNNQDKGNLVSSRFLEDGSYLRMRSLTLGYKLDLNKYNIKNVRFFLAGENLFTLTKYSGVDPEIPANDNGDVITSAGPGVYPAVRKYIFGLNVTF